MNLMTSNSGVSRRGLLRIGAVLTAAVALPSKLWAAMARPEKAFTATDMGATFAELGGTPEVSDQIDFETPDIAENGAVVPVTIHSKIPGTTKIFVMVEKNPNPLSGGFEIMDGTEAYVETRVKVAQTCDLYAVVEAGGKLYMAKKETKVTLGGCGG